MNLVAGWILGILSTFEYLGPLGTTSERLLRHTEFDEAAFFSSRPGDKKLTDKCYVPIV